jgi:nickel-dependent lactate racemase
VLSQQQIRETINRAFEEWQVYGKRVLFILPDNTRTAPIAQIFPVIYRLLHQHTPTVDSLIALGTHLPLSASAICRRIGVEGDSWQPEFPRARFFNHDWHNPEQLITIGTLSEELVTKLSEGRLSQAVPVTINRLIQHYDMLVIIGPVFPHEVVGFSGGNKYFFPGIAGPEIIDLFHWLGALITNRTINGQKYTPVRAIVDAAAQLIPAERRCISLVVAEDSAGNREGLAGIFTGTPEATWSQAADLSARLNIVYVDKPFRRVLAQAPEMYTDLWTGGKCMYKLEPVVADGGELIIYAPHISEVSPVHGKLLLQIGYHVRDYFLKQWDKFKDYPGGILAHSTHIKGAGEFVDGIEQPRIKVTLATGIPEEICKKINLGYLNPGAINIDDWKNRDDVLYVPKAGEVLYRLKNDRV